MTEDQLQSRCWIWAWNTFPQTRRMLWAVPNGGSRLIIEAKKFQATGLVAGVHDLHFLWSGRLNTFELKVGENELTRDRVVVTPSGREKLMYGQYEWGVKMTEQGGRWFEVREEDVFRKIFTDLVYNRI